MLIQGLFNPSHVIRELFLCEYAFSIHWSKTKEVRVAHRKGVWYLVKVSKDKVVDYFEIDDTWNFPTKPNGLLEGFLKSQRELYDDETSSRPVIAHALCELLHFWADDLKNIDIINVVQPGRNASINQSTGMFDLSPRPEDWKK